MAAAKWSSNIKGKANFMVYHSAVHVATCVYVCCDMQENSFQSVVKVDDDDSRSVTRKNA